MNIIFITLGILFSLVLFVVFAFVAVTYVHFKYNQKQNNSILGFGNIYEFRFLANKNLIEELYTLNDNILEFQLDIYEYELSNYYTYLHEYFFKKFIYPILINKFYFHSEDKPNLKENNTDIFFECIG